MNAVAPSAAPAAPLASITPRSLLDFLWSRAAAHLPRHDLQWLAGMLPELIAEYTQQLESVYEGVGVLTAADAGGHGATGALQGGAQVSMLMFAASNQMSLLTGLARIASDADARLGTVYQCKGQP